MKRNPEAYRTEMTSVEFLAWVRCWKTWADKTCSTPILLITARAAYYGCAQAVWLPHDVTQPQAARITELTFA